MLKQLKHKRTYSYLLKDLKKGRLIVINGDVYVVNGQSRHYKERVSLTHIITRTTWIYKSRVVTIIDAHEGTIRSHVAALCVYWALYKQLRKIPKEIAKIIAKYVLWTYTDSIWNE